MAGCSPPYPKLERKDKKVTPQCSSDSSLTRMMDNEKKRELAAGGKGQDMPAGHSLIYTKTWAAKRNHFLPIFRVSNVTITILIHCLSSFYESRNMRKI